MLARLRSAVRQTPPVRDLALRAMALTRSVARAEPGLYTLCYHRIAATSRAGFARQIDYLRHYGTFVGPDLAVELLESGATATGRYFLLTFDDGYADNHDVALPVLRDAGVPAIVFLVSDWVGGPARGTDTFLSPGQVEAWLGAGLAIGSHTASHAHLSRLDAADVAAELARSKAMLSALSGAPVRHFACPWGVAGRDFLPDRDPGLAQAQGYRTFFTTRRGRALGGADLPLMPRHVMEPEWDLFHLDALLGGRDGVSRH